MDKLIPLDVSIRQNQLDKRHQKQREEMNQRHITKHFDGGTRTTDKGSAFNDTYTASVYAQIRANDAGVKDDMVHATSSAPYRQGRKTK